MVKNSTQSRSRVWMYTQQIKFLPWKISDLPRRLEHLPLKRWAFIIHDADPGVASHLHLFLESKNPTTAKSLAHHFSDKPQYFENFSKNHTNHSAAIGFSYLIHRTDGAIKANKVLYDPSRVVANFNYSEFIQKVSQVVRNKKSPLTPKKMESLLANKILDDFAEERISKSEAEQKLLAINGHTLGSYFGKLNELNAAKLNLKAEIIYKEMIKKNKPVIVNYFYGPSGVGKTAFARMLANKKYPNNVFFTGPAKNPYDGLLEIDYLPEVLIIDEVRKETFSSSFREMLQLLDPYRYLYSKTVRARYHNPSIISVKEIYLTAPMSPQELFWTFQKSGNSSDDDFSQLDRRLSTVIKFDKENVQEVIFDPKEQKYIPKGAPMPNPVKDLIATQSNKITLKQLLKLTSSTSQNKKGDISNG
ncbi:Rep family protein [Oenococcus oeni]|uniref:Rep family protein n=1 Tax=Oenococcus oeni TaxID=1247 RepID=UPI000A9A5758|nr:Rep family protein [Oenococcus oeni]